jgi:prepilin-type N-terminal cleavage/methylation domain-containing protein
MTGALLELWIRGMMDRLPLNRSKLNRSKSNSDGFTLIEMLVVIVMVGILMAIAAPSWLGFMSARRVNAANDQVLQAIRQAQAEALRTKQSQTVSFNVTANPPTITAFGATTVLGEGALKPNMVAMSIPRGTTSPNCTTGNCIEFNGNGNVMNTLTQQGINIVLADPNNPNSKRCVVVQTLLGAVRTDRRTGCD